MPVHQVRGEGVPQAVQAFLRNSGSFEDSVVPFAEIPRSGVIAVSVRHKGRIFAEIGLSAQVLDHRHCRPIQRHGALTGGAFGFSDFDLPPAGEIRTVSSRHFLYALPHCQRFIFKVNVAVQQTK